MLATSLVLLLSGLPSLAAASDSADASKAVLQRGKKRKSASAAAPVSARPPTADPAGHPLPAERGGAEAAERVTADQLMEMSPQERRAFFREAAPEVPMPANFGTDELDEAQAQLSSQYYQGMADTLKVVGQAAGTNAAALPPVLKAPQLAATPGKHIALGLADHLDDFAKSVGGSTWKEWARANPTKWKSAFTEIMSNPANRVSFNLTGIYDAWRAVSRSAAGRGGATDWELLQIKTNPQWWERITFFRDGKVVPNPFQ